MHIKAKRAYTLVEIMVVVVIVGFLAAMLVPKLLHVANAGGEGTARLQAKQLGDVLGRWLSAQPSVAAARTSFNPTATADTPADLAAFLTELKEHLSETTRDVYFVSATSPDRIVTKCMEENGWYMRVIWPGATYTTVEPKIEFNGP